MDGYQNDETQPLAAENKEENGNKKKTCLSWTWKVILCLILIVLAIIVGMTYHIGNQHLQCLKNEIKALRKDLWVYYPKGTEQNHKLRYYDKYNALFMGYGMPTTGIDYPPKTNVSFDGCMKYCFNLKGNGVVTFNYHFTARDCHCSKDLSRKSSDEDIQFKFMREVGVKGVAGNGSKH